MKTSFEKLDMNISVVDTLVRLYYDNQRNCFADQIKYWVMTPECLDHLRKETSREGHHLYDINWSEDSCMWKFMDIPIATVAVRGTNYQPYVEAVY